MFSNPMQEARINVQPMQLASLLNLMAQGQLQVPRFQREFVWPLTKTRSLLDSMFKEYPIGTFFFWQAPKEQSGLFRELPGINIPQPQDGVPISFILDGQQRLTSLFATINGLLISGRDYSRICIDLEEAARFEAESEKESGESDETEARIFVHRQPDNRRFVTVRDFLRQSNYEIYDQIPKEWRPVFTKAANRFETYPLSVVWVKDQGLNEVVDIFQRINQGGKRLSRYDLVCANLWEPDFDFRSEVSTFNETLENQGFGAIDGTIVTQSFSLVLDDRCTTAAELKLKTEDVRRVWADVIKSLRLAIDFVKSNFGVMRYEFLPYRGILPVLADFFYSTPKSAINAEQREILWQWFWRVTLSERYGSTSPSRMAEDALKLRKMLAGNSIRFDYPSKVTARSVARTNMTAASSSLRNAFLCLLALRQPRNLKDGSLVNLNHDFFSNLKQAERHHIFPKAFLQKNGVSGRAIHVIPNFCFIPADLNKEISSQSPSTYMKKYRKENPQFADCAASHFIPIDKRCPIWKNDFQGFVEARADILSRALNALIDKGPFDSLVKTDVEIRSKDSEIVGEIELRIRNLIDTHLTDVAGEDYWSWTVPGSIQKKALARIKIRIQEHPYEDLSKYASGRAHLDKCDVIDYQKIIIMNWKQFSSIFQNQETFKRHMASFRKYRNAVAHNDQLNSVDRKLSEAAVEWLRPILSKFEEQRREALQQIENSELEVVVE